MTRVVGINLPDDKKIIYALTLIYGIGWAISNILVKRANVDGNKKVKELSEDELKRIQKEIDTIKVEGVLKEDILTNIKRLREIGSYRGLRHTRGLPVSGQRTKSNARTKRGKRKTVGALKKEDQAKLTQQAVRK